VRIEDIHRTFSLEGRAAAVTGGASGIGRATAETLAAAGAGVVIGDLDALADRAVAEFGRLDAMCNVAGIAADGLIADATEELIDRAVAVNVKGVVFGCQAALRVMTPQGSGSIVNVSSTAIDAPAPRYGVYAMTKAAVAMLTKTLALEAGRHGIRVNTIAPGATETEFTRRHLYESDGSINSAKYEAFVEQMRKISPLGMVGDPLDQAYLILYLVSDAARWCTGQTWRVNGGQALP